ncbi:MAG: hypothetical protein JNL90_12270 [Planctomycetes bacterium]|nr:hypothetical protein [Planctomycetota bacterium]
MPTREPGREENDRKPKEGVDVPAGLIPQGTERAARATPGNDGDRRDEGGGEQAGIGPDGREFSGMSSRLPPSDFGGESPDGDLSEPTPPSVPRPGLGPTGS